MSGAQKFWWMLWALLILTFVNAHAGTCVNRQDGDDAIQTCDNGSYTVYHRNGRVDQWGYRNGGFDRYPGGNYQPRWMRRGY